MEPSPKIIHLEWGSIETDVGRFKDVKLWPGGGREWDWRETGTSHRPGVQPADVTEILEHGVARIIVGSGHTGRLSVPAETYRTVEQGGAILEVSESAEAVDRYNAAAERREAVAALIHSTC